MRRQVPDRFRVPLASVAASYELAPGTGKILRLCVFPSDAESEEVVLAGHDWTKAQVCEVVSKLLGARAEGRAEGRAAAAKEMRELLGLGDILDRVEKLSEKVEKLGAAASVLSFPH